MMFCTKNIIKSICMAICCFFIYTNFLCAETIGQRIEIPSSPNPVGSGARALGMGGAFIAIADDATAASWNPGGLIWLDKPELSVVGAYFSRTEDNSFGLHPEADRNQSVSRTNINYISAAFPFAIAGHEMVVSVNYQNLYDFKREWNFHINQATDIETSTSMIDYKSNGDLSAIGLAYCIQVTENFSIGVTFNIWNDQLSPNNWESRYKHAGAGINSASRFEKEIFISDKYSFEGYNLNFGILWRNLFNGHLTIGAVFKTPFEADLTRNYYFSSNIRYPDFPDYNASYSTSLEENSSLDMPMSYGVGVAWRFSDDFTISFDIYRTHWNDFILTDSNGQEISPVTGKSPENSEIDPTNQVRMGMEYLGFQTEKYVFPITCGLFYDPAPASGSPDDFYGFSIGTGITDKFHFTFDIAYQFRFGKDTGSSILETWKFSQDVYEHKIYSSLIVYF